MSNRETVTVIIPVYNEESTIVEVVRSVLDVDTPLTKQILIVNDGSTDGTAKCLAELERQHSDVSVLHHEVNLGKGASIRTALQQVQGFLVIIQDADLEYDPALYPRLMKPILEGKADVVFGSRFMGSDPHRVLYFWHYFGNKMLTLVSNMLTNLNLTDMEVGHKVFRFDCISDIDLKENRFGFEPEITAKLARKGAIIYEVGIPYFGRSYSEGKKIGWKDGFAALFAILRYNILR